MVAFITSSLIGVLGLVGVVLYGRRRAPGARLTWGEAMLAATFAFFMFFWWYGVIPHQWLTLADAEWDWSKSNLLWGPGEILKPYSAGGHFPWELNKQHLRDIVATLLYGVGIGLHIWIWAWWNDREKKADAQAAVVPTSTYGRPLVKKG